MKNTLALFIILYLTVTGCFGQSQKDAFFLETAFKLGVNMDNCFVRGTGLSISNRSFSDQSSYDYGEYSNHKLGWALAPRAGYYLAENFISGMDIQYVSYKYLYHYLENKTDYSQFAIGIFLRWYFIPQKKFSPYLEGSVGSGTSHTAERIVSSAGEKYTHSWSYNLFYYALDLGVARRITPQLTINASFRFQNTVEKSPHSSDSSSGTGKFNNYEWVPSLSLQYSLIKKKDQQKKF
jgi:hypothetical protein